MGPAGTQRCRWAPLPVTSSTAEALTMTPGEATLTIAAIQPTCLVTLAHHCCRSRMLSCVDGPIGNTAGQRPRRTWNLNSSIPFRIAGSGQTRDRRGISPPLLRTPAFSVAKKKKKKRAQDDALDNRLDGRCSKMGIMRLGGVDGGQCSIGAALPSTRANRRRQLIATRAGP